MKEESPVKGNEKRKAESQVKENEKTKRRIAHERK